jgi:hypothetical protein
MNAAILLASLKVIDERYHGYMLLTSEVAILRRSGVVQNL